MEEVSLSDGVAIALDALLADRLALLAGAGLSMAPPSLLPSADAIAQAAKARYDATYGASRAPLSPSVIGQAEFFFQRGELATVYFRSLIDENAFAGRPNPGHMAVADLLLCRGIQTAVTTNVDPLIETAGQLLLGQVGVGVDVPTVAALLPNTAPLLKIHGCRVIDQPNMVWAPGQLGTEPVSTRIADSAQWLKVRLLDRDLLIVGYWSDWDYLNEVLETVLRGVRPTRVIVVNTEDGSQLATRAPSLWALGKRANAAFLHVQASGADFLDLLRLEFSKTFVRRVLASGIDEFRVLGRGAADPSWVEPPDLDNEMYWQVRRDLEGRRPNEPARDRAPAPGSLVGLTLLQLRAKGAASEGPYWILGGSRIRVLQAFNKTLPQVQAEFARATPPSTAPDITIAVGAEAQGLLPSIARGTGPTTIVRGGGGRWLSRTEAVTELAL